MRRIVNFRAAPLFALTLIAGILVSFFTEYIYAVILTAIGISAIVLLLLIPKYKRYLPRIILVVIAFIIAICSSHTLLALNSSGAQDRSGVRLIGEVSDMTEFSQNGRVDSDIGIIYLQNVRVYDEEGNVTKYKGKVKTFMSLSARPDKSYRIGDTLELYGSIKRDELSAKDSYSVASYNNGVRYTIRAESTIAVEQGKPPLFAKIKIAVKDGLMLKAKGESANFIYAMLFGDSSALSKDLKTNFSKVGAAHIFAVSGLHIGIIAAIIFFFTKRLKEYKRFIILSLILIGYAFICGFSPSVVRAVAMISIFMLSRLFGLRNDSISTLSVAACVLLIFNPINLFDLSFLMSFLAVIGIIFFAKPIKNSMSYLPQKLSTMLSLSISVNIGIFPIMICYFGSLSWLFVIANMIIVPLISVLYPFIFILTLLSSFIPYMGYTLLPFNYAIEGIIYLTQIIAKLNMPNITLSVSKLFMVVYLVIMTLVSPYIFTSRRFKKGVAVLAICSVSVCTFFAANGVFDYVGKSVYVTGSSRSGYVILEEDKDYYLVVNGVMDDNYMQNVRRHMISNNIDSIEAIIKYEYTDYELYLLKYYAEEFQTEKFYVNKIRGEYYSIVGGDFYEVFIGKDFGVSFYSANEIGITLNGVDILFTNCRTDDIFAENRYFDIIYSIGTDLSAARMSPKYLVSDTAVSENLPNAVNNHFTFRLKNGKITKIGGK